MEYSVEVMIWQDKCRFKTSVEHQLGSGSLPGVPLSGSFVDNRMFWRSYFEAGRALATCVELVRSTGELGMSDYQLKAMIENEARALGLTFEDAVSRVQKGQVGDNYLWQDLSSLVRLLYE